jgi:hypothetical protein
MVTNVAIADAKRQDLQIEQVQSRIMALSSARETKQENPAMRKMRTAWPLSVFAALTGILVVLTGCRNTPVDTSDYALGPAPGRMPSPAKEAEACRSYEDSLTGGQVFEMYCSYCHNAPSLAERPYSQFRNIAAHMRVRANLTGKEYAKLMEFLRRWNDVPPPTAPVEPTPKRFYFSQPIQELREQTEGPKAPPAQGTAAENKAPK